ncbi:bile acid:sodium symporter family protein [Lysobacter niastensis]|uniref:Bile acid:sodium symporter family protein n=1 Tax=Lysobacter niastensis TaxID=380629 RepID=A0ABS0BBF1_9GAMM|nr:bile acid:sodium symporter family protein [Lysobacter niastensis]MBF6024450.1 bile acid:sodium symporter family protein [Lysobacter niastensis]
MEDNLLIRVALPLVNFIIMCGIGLTLEVADFRRIGRSPKSVAVGVAGHYLLLPAIGFVMAYVFRDTPGFAIGFVLLAACPSASVSNTLSYLAGGNVALAVALTAISAVASLLSVPAWILLAARAFDIEGRMVQLPVSETIARLAVLVLLPVALGMGARHWARAWALRVQPWISRVALLSLILVVVAFAVTQWELVSRSISELGAATLAMSAAAMVGGLLLARAVKLSFADSVTISIEVGVQNCMLAMLVALTILHSVQAALPAATYGLMMFVPALAVVALGRRARREAPQT